MPSPQVKINDEKFRNFLKKSLLKQGAPEAAEAVSNLSSEALQAQYLTLRSTVQLAMTSAALAFNGAKVSADYTSKWGDPAANNKAQDNLEKATECYASVKELYQEFNSCQEAQEEELQDEDSESESPHPY